MACRCFIHSSSCKFYPNDLCLEHIADLSSRLLFMTYNGWIMISVGVGAVVGYLLFGNGSSSKSAACH